MAGTIVPWNEHGVLLNERPSFTLDPLFHAGCYYVQDSSAMFVGYLFRKILEQYYTDTSRTQPLRVLDLCAAPGGKTTDLAASLRSSFSSNFQLVSNEVMKARASVLCDNVALWGDSNVVVTSVDPAAFASFKGYFDIIVADVPCSGEGMFFKDPKARQMWSPEVVNLCASRQKRILADVWPALKSGGVLVYSTCTYESVENDDNLFWVAQELGGQIIEPKNEYSEYGVELTQYGSLLRDGVVPGEGQWVGALIKTAEQSVSRNVDLSQLRPLRYGISKGELKGKDFIPNPDWALSIDFDINEYPSIELSLETALKFLHRDSLVLKDAPIGYNVITYQAHPLGFVKNIGQRCNNLLPKGRRILMNI